MRADSGATTAALPYIDTHVHLNDERYAADLREVIDNARRAGVEYMICPGCDSATSLTARDLAIATEGLFYGVGYHPHEAQHAAAAFYDWARAQRGDPKLVAVGEIGLDYHYDLSPREVQREVFAAQLGLAHELGLPVLVHDREAHEDTVDLLRAHSPGVRGVLHCYSGSWETAKQCLDMGYYVSFAGAVTFKSASRLRDVAAKIPLDRLLSETDGPYLAPEPFRGRRNEPRHVVEVVRQLATLHGMTVEQMASVILVNAQAIFTGVRSHVASQRG